MFNNFGIFKFIIQRKREFLFLLIIWLVFDCGSIPKVDWYKKSKDAFDMKKWDKVINQVNRLLETDNHGKSYLKNRALYYRGVAYLKKKKNNLALKDFNHSIQIDKNFAPVYVSRGMIFQKMKNPEKAISDFSRCLQIDEDVFSAYFLRGIENKKKKKHEHAIADFTRAINLNPKYADAYFMRGIVYSDIGDYENTVLDLSKCININQDHKEARENHGYFSFYLKRFSNAHTDFSKLIKTDPKNPYFKIWQYLSNKRADKMDSSNLEAYLKEVVENKWPIPVIQLFMGNISVKECERKAAHSDKQKDLEQRCEANFYIGQFFLLKGEKSNAKECFKECISTKIIDFYEYKGAMAELFPNHFIKSNVINEKSKAYLRFTLIDLSNNKILKSGTICRKNISFKKVKIDSDSLAGEIAANVQLKDKPILEDRFVRINDNFIIRNRVFGYKEIASISGFGFSVLRTDRQTFSWEWYNKRVESTFEKLQGQGSLKVEYARKNGYHVISKIFFKGDHVLRCLHFPNLNITSNWHCIIYNGSYIKWY